MLSQAIPNKILHGILLTSLLVNISYAQTPPPMDNTQKKENLPPFNAELPVFKEKYNFVVKRIFLDRKLYQLLDLKKRNYLFTVKKLANLYLATYPKLLFLKSSIYIKIHKEFITKVLFPYRIVGVISSSKKLAMLNYNENVLFLQGSEDFLVGNLEVFLQKDNGEKKIVNVYVEELNPLIATKPQIFYSTYLILRYRKLNPIKILEFYRAKYGKYPDRDTKISIAGVVYSIKVNPTKPNISIGDKDFLVRPLSLF